MSTAEWLKSLVYLPLTATLQKCDGLLTNSVDSANGPPYKTATERGAAAETSGSWRASVPLKPLFSVSASAADSYRLPIGVE